MKIITKNKVLNSYVQHQFQTPDKYELKKNLSENMVVKYVYGKRLTCMHFKSQKEMRINKAKALF